MTIISDMQGQSDLFARRLSSTFVGSDYITCTLFITLVTQGLSSEDILMQLYLLVLSNIESWVDVSSNVCMKLARGGMLLQNINDLQYLGGLPVDKSEV